MMTQPLSHTLQQLHITINNVASSPFFLLPDAHFWPRMEALHTFTFVTSFKWHFRNEWALVDTLTSSNVMPLLRRMNFCIVIHIDDLNQINHSALFADYRHIDVNYAFMITDNRQHIELRDYVPHGSQSHPHEIVSATFISEYWPDNQSFKTPGLRYVSYQFIKIISYFTEKLSLYQFGYFLFYRRSNREIDNIYSTLCHGSSVNLFSYVFQIDVLTI